MRDYHEMMDDLEYYPAPSDFGYYYKDELPDFNAVKEALKATFESMYVKKDEDKARENLEFLLDEFMINIPKETI